MADPMLLAYLGYLAWLLAGFGDFMCHRRADLPHTSGLRESVLHLVQLALIGSAIVLGVLFEIGRTVAVILLSVVIAHALIGYLDTRVAFAKRVLVPLEQHLHSVLDMAPWIAFACAVALGWPDAIAPGWRWVLRVDAFDPARLGAVLVPAGLLCGVPALLEWRACLAARREGLSEEKS